MTEEELTQLRDENSLLREQTGLQQETIRLQQQLVERQQVQISLLEQERSLQQQQISHLSEQVKELQERLAKDSHNSHLPPSSDRFGRQKRSLRKPSGKKSGGQGGHPGRTLIFSPTPDEVIVHAVHRCEHCQRDLGQVPAQVIEVSSKWWISRPRACWITTKLIPWL